MKKLLLLLTVCTVALCASASNRYISPTGSDGDGKSWANAVHTITQAIWSVGVGDTMFIAEGVYTEQISAQNGATYLGGYNAETGERNPELYETIIDGTGVTSFLVVKYGLPTATVTLDGLIFQNSAINEWGAAAMFLRGDMVIDHCIIRNCKGTERSGSDLNAGAIYIEDNDTEKHPIIRNTLIEYCEGTAGCAAIYNNSGIIENCIFRGCKGPLAVVRNMTTTSIVRNCLFYNNTITGAGSLGAIDNEGIVINNTICNNLAEERAGIYTHSGGQTYNCVFWGNKGAASYTNPVNYISSSSSSSHNVADQGTASNKFLTTSLAADNTAENGPNFRNPTGFVGIPKTDAEKLAVKKADFSLTAASTLLVDKGLEEGAPEKDINGVDRPKKDGIDVGAYEYDPDAVHIAVTGVSIVPASIEVIEGKTGTLVAQIEPANADEKRVEWSIDDESIATIKNGKVTGVKPGTTYAHAKTVDGEFTADAEVIIKEKPPVKYPQEVLDAEANYLMKDYTIPSYIEFLVPKTAAKIDSLDPDNAELLPSIAGNIELMNAAIANLQPKEEPYNLIATFNGDPKTHMGFCWFTNEGINEGQVQLLPGVATAEDFATIDGVMSINATPTTTIPLHYTPIQGTESPKYDICTAAGLPRNTKFTYVSHKALAENLKPGTVYSWRAGFDGHWSDVYQFRTQDAEQGDFSFVYMSDSHIHNAKYIESANQCAKAVAKNEPDVKFCVFPGDFVETGDDTNSEWQWERWFEGAIKPTLMKMAIVPTGGNHDVSNNLNYDYHFNTNHEFYNSITNRPVENRPQFHGVTYSFVYGDVLFLVYSLEDWWRVSGTSEEGMQSSYLSVDVANWFKQEIEKYPNTKYRVTVTHKNLFSGADHHVDGDAPLLRAMMLPVLKECGIDLAIQGHDHCYEVIGPVDPDNLTVVEGSITDRKEVSGGTNANMTGYEGGTFTTDEGTLYFIGATCGEKRYGPKTRAQLDEQYTEDLSLLYDGHHHNVKDYFNLFTSKFGQPQTPSYSRFNVTSEYIEIISYKTDANGNKEVFNTIRVKNNRPSSVPAGVDNAKEDGVYGEKYLHDGQLYIRKNGRLYNVMGQEIAQ